jgi:hypothetical protein
LTTTTRRGLFLIKPLGRRITPRWPELAQVHPDEFVEVAARDGWVNSFALLLHKLDEPLAHFRPILRLPPPARG